jgi:hypothetical protein
MNKSWQWNFDGEEPGTSPQQFHVILGNWVIRSDSGAPSAPNVLAQEAVFPQGIHFPVAWQKTSIWPISEWR